MYQKIYHLTGFGGYDLATLVTPPLTTIKFENEKTGHLAAETIIDLMEGRDVAGTTGYWLSVNQIKKC